MLKRCWWILPLLGILVAHSGHSKNSTYQHHTCHLHSTPGHGLFSLYISLMAILADIEAGHYCAAVLHLNTPPYYDADYGPDWWNYYFEPLSFHSEKKCRRQRAVALHRTTRNYEIENKNALFGNRLIEKYIKLKPEIAALVEQEAARLFHNDFVVGVHYRGTDKSSEAAPVLIEDMIAHVKYIMRNQTTPFTLFLATDEAVVVDRFCEAFPKVVYLDIPRSRSKQALHFSKSLRPYELGLSAILDCYLLAKCNLLIRTSSNLSFVASRISPYMPVAEISVRR